jgi:hypothetical protein
MLEKIFLATELYSCRLHHSLFSPLEIDPVAWSHILIFVFNVYVTPIFTNVCFVLPSSRLLARNQQPIYDTFVSLNAFTLSAPCVSLKKPFIQPVMRNTRSRCLTWLSNVRERTSETNQTDRSKRRSDCWFNYFVKNKLVMQRTVIWSICRGSFVDKILVTESANGRNIGQYRTMYTMIIIWRGLFSGI